MKNNIPSGTPANVSKIFGGTIEGARDKYRKQSAEMLQFADKASTNPKGKYNGKTASEWRRLSEDFARRANL